MQEVFNFLVAHWEAILGVISLILSVVIFAIKKRPLNDVFTDIVTWSVYGILDAEISHLPGEAKLLRATNYVLNCLKNKYPGINCDDYRKAVITTIEYILSTPQKKGDK